MSASVETSPPVAGPRAGGRGTGRQRLLDRAAVAVPTALAAVLSIWDITGRSLGFDESASVTIAAQHGSALGHAVAHDGGNMSGYYLSLHLWVELFGNSELSVRFGAALASVAAVALVAALAARLFDRRATVIAGMLAAVSVPLVFWAQSARGYAFLVALSAGSFLAFVALVEARTEGRSGRGAWVAYVVSTALAGYMSLMAVLVAPAQLLLALVNRRRALRPAITAWAACAVCWIPLAVLATSRGSGQLFWLPRPNWGSEKQVLESLTSTGLEPSFHARWPTFVGLGLTLAALLVLAVVVMLRRQWAPALLLSWLVVPVFVAWLESLVGQPIFLARNLLISLPAVALLLGWGLADRRLPAAVAWTALIALLALRAYPLSSSYGISPEDWRGATASVLARVHRGDCIAFYPSDGRMAFRYYLRASPAPRPVLPTAPWRQVRAYVEDYATLSGLQIARLPSNCPRLWFISSHEGQPDGPAGALAHRARYLALRVGLEREYPIHQVRLFGYADAARVELLTGATSFRRR